MSRIVTDSYIMYDQDGEVLQRRSVPVNTTYRGLTAFLRNGEESMDGLGVDFSLSNEQLEELGFVPTDVIEDRLMEMFISAKNLDIPSNLIGARRIALDAAAAVLGVRDSLYELEAELIVFLDKIDEEEEEEEEPPVYEGCDCFFCSLPEADEVPDVVPVELDEYVYCSALDEMIDEETSLEHHRVDMEIFGEASQCCEVNCWLCGWVPVDYEGEAEAHILGAPEINRTETRSA